MENKVCKMRKNNMRLFPIYEAIGLDFIFYYGIKVLFLSQVKGISDSNIVLSSSLYAIFAIIAQIPICGIVSKIGKRRSMIYGNMLKLISMVIIIYCPNFLWLVISNFIMATGFSMTGISANPILNASIPEAKNKGDIFSKIYGKGYAMYCYICAISTVLSGYLYTINPYIPLWLCAFATAFAVLISYNFIEIEEYTKKEKEIVAIKQNIIDIKEGFIEVFKSERLKSLLLMTGVIWGLLCLFSTYQTTLLKNMNVSATYIGIIAAIVQIVTGRYSKKANDFNEKNSNKSLTKMALGITLGAITIALIVLLDIPLWLQVISITILFCTRHAYKGFFQILRYRYMGNFASDKLLPKIYACNSIMANVMRAVVEYIGSVTLLFIDIKYATLTIGIVFTLICVWISKYMKTRIGVYKQDLEEEEKIA